jgi:hypothetical protein
MEAYFTLRDKYAALPRPEPLPLAQKIANLSAATAKWIRHGLPVVDQAEIEARAAICYECELWLRERLIPSCAACGCGDVKHELATEACPAGKWAALKGAETGV